MRVLVITALLRHCVTAHFSVSPCGDTSGRDVNFIIVRIAVQLDLHAVYSTVQ